jgi:predicted short-subunit dehydrogenase-like oxidoreductase (DUF2520 family)
MQNKHRSLSISSQKKPHFFVIGAGRVGASLCFQILQKGFPIISLVEKSEKRLTYLHNEYHWTFLDTSVKLEKISKAHCIIISVQDDFTQIIVEQLAKLDVNWEGKHVFHCSGILPSSILSPLKKLGALTASLHPIYSFSLDPRENNHFDKVWFSVEGENKTKDFVYQYFKSRKNQIIKVNEDQKRAIHLACVFSANFLVGLTALSCQILQKNRLSEIEVLGMLNPLMASTVDHITDQGISKGLTGPVKRGDIKTIHAHLNLLKSNYPALLELYRDISLILVEQSGLTSQEKKRLKILFSKIKNSDKN